MALVFRNSSYYYRRRTPKDISDIIGLTEVCRSLRTKNRPEAWLRAAAYDKKFNEVCVLVREGNINELTLDDIDRIINMFRSNRLEEIETDVIEYSEERSNLTPDEYGDFIREDGLKVQSELKHNQQDKVDALAKELLSEMGFEPDEQSQEYNILKRRLLEVRVELSVTHLKQHRGDISVSKNTVLNNSTQPINSETVDYPKLSELIIEYEKFKIASKDWQPKTNGETMQKLDVMVKFFNDKPINIIDKKMASEFHLLLTELPKNFANLIQRTTATNASLIKMARNNKQKQGATLSDKTIYDKYMSSVKAFYKWVVNHHDYIIKNPFDHLRAYAKVSNARNEREDFTDKELKTIFDKDYLLSRTYPHKPPFHSHFWIPHIMLYTGARPDEIAQLLVADIKHDHDIWYFSINEVSTLSNHPKHVKTISSVRDIPIHPVLIEAGFIDYVIEKRSNGEVKLWPNLKKQVNGYSNAVTKWFNRKQVKDKGITTGNKASYSLRHTVSTRLFDKDVPEAIINQVLGHEGNTMSSKRYNKGQTMEKLLSHMIKMDIPTPKGLEVLIKQRLQK